MRQFEANKIVEHFPSKLIKKLIKKPGSNKPNSS